MSTSASMRAMEKVGLVYLHKYESNNEGDEGSGRTCLPLQV